MNKVYEEMNYNTDSQSTSFSEFEFLSSTDPTEEGIPPSLRSRNTQAYRPCANGSNTGT